MHKRIVAVSTLLRFQVYLCLPQVQAWNMCGWFLQMEEQHTPLFRVQTDLLMTPVSFLLLHGTEDVQG